MKKLFFIILAVLPMAVGIGCSSKLTQRAPGPTGPSTPDGSGNNDDFSSKGDAIIRLGTAGDPDAFLNDFTNFVRAHGSYYTYNNIQNVRLGVDVDDVDPSSVDLYGGNITIIYDDVINGNKSTKYLYGTVLKDTYSAQYNKWVHQSGDDYFKAFFETESGALILIGNIDDDLNIMKGRLYFHKHRFEYCSYENTYPWYGCGQRPITLNPPVNCWNITWGSYPNNQSVYDCRAFFDGSGTNVNTSVSLYPESDLYTQIGEFDGLFMEQAGIKDPN